MQHYANFIDAITETLAAIHASGYCSPVNGFAVTEHENGVYEVTGESWTFYLRYETVPLGKGWIVYDTRPMQDATRTE